MTDKSRPVHLLGLRTDVTTIGLSPQQRELLALMHAYRFGRFENLKVRSGQPVFDQSVKLVRVARLDSESDNTPIANPEHFELKKQVRALFAELARLENGTVVRLDFRHGLPHLIEVRSDDFLKPAAT